MRNMSALILFLSLCFVWHCAPGNQHPGTEQGSGQDEKQGDASSKDRQPAQESTQESQPELPATGEHQPEASQEAPAPEEATQQERPAETLSPDAPTSERSPEKQTTRERPPLGLREDDAWIEAHNLPAELKAGASQDVFVKVLNTGRSTWGGNGSFKLGTIDDSDPFYGQNRVWLPAGSSVKPGETHTFRFTLKAPARSGSYTTDWQMVHEGVRWFGDKLIHTVKVTGSAPSTVDPTTMNKKLMMGYQGWFACPKDGSTLNRWHHWFRTQDPTAANATFDMWPDLSEAGPSERCPTSMTLPGGQPAPLYSAYNAQTVMRHFRWMKEHNLDGVFLQRFTVAFSSKALMEFRNKVTQNVRAGAEKHLRTWAIMYDISGHKASTLVQDIKDDWHFLVDQAKVTQSPRYLRHNGRPVLAIWGLGFADRPGTPAQAKALLDYLKTSAPAKYRVTLVGGVPTHWRTRTNDAKTDAAWDAIYRSFDVISPWAVGRYGDDAGADNFKKNQIQPDLTATKSASIGYMPVVFPGFTWRNLTGKPANQIPRRGGHFFWRQAYNAVHAGSNMLYVAMFDEVDEGTAMFKVAPTKAQLPTQGTFVPLDIDGYKLPSDWYLRLADHASRMLRGEQPLSPTIPLTPPK